ncbi:hypothetical protein [Haloarcula pellucida]|uniref:Uncharacterized protein n=1 Tax=Haloarcula pellucida TaxID=1427151 RepID=A0A830GRY3_9EURY|nr:hypothetical protein [Halomicroarcula pellucida]MBX0350536.1 hypothetical protein [Halomicroarcula pellucida]GGO03777.1 hypothetical protein GCM10009030_39810 [Halomicroarcula pellucida]
MIAATLATWAGIAMFAFALGVMAASHYNETEMRWKPIAAIAGGVFLWTLSVALEMVA